MKNGKCPNCGSTEIYVSRSPLTENLTVKAATKNTDVFATEAYLCLECRKMEVYAQEISATLFGKGKTIKDCIPNSENWKKL